MAAQRTRPSRAPHRRPCGPDAAELGTEERGVSGRQERGGCGLRPACDAPTTDELGRLGSSTATLRSSQLALGGTHPTGGRRAGVARRTVEPEGFGNSRGSKVVICKSRRGVDETARRVKPDALFREYLDLSRDFFRPALLRRPVEAPDRASAFDDPVTWDARGKGIVFQGGSHRLGRRAVQGLCYFSVRGDAASWYCCG